MIIKYTNGTEENTDQMDDNTAEMMERTKDFLDFCISRGIAVYCKFYFPHSHEHSGFHNFNNNSKHGLILMGKLLEGVEDMTGLKLKLVEEE